MKSHGNPSDPTEIVRKVGERLREEYEGVATRYRENDEIEVTTGHHQAIAASLGRISASFGRPIRALDVGCGTGRYFHCLRGVDCLVGLDLSPAMLRLARDPVRREQVSVRDVQLVCGDVLLMDFRDGAFDFIYSLGMFGYGIPVTVGICERFHRWLAPGGKLFFNVIDLAGLSLRSRLRHRVGQVFRRLTHRRVADGAIPFCPLTAHELESIMQRTSFRKFTISSRESDSPLWRGRHLECFAVKGLDS